MLVQMHLPALLMLPAPGPHEALLHGDAELVFGEGNNLIDGDSAPVFQPCDCLKNVVRALFNTLRPPSGATPCHFSHPVLGRVSKKPQDEPQRAIAKDSTIFNF